MNTWYNNIWNWLTWKCHWCKNRNCQIITFGGNHKYTDLTMCKKCFYIKWPSMDYDSSKNTYSR